MVKRHLDNKGKPDTTYPPFDETTPITHDISDAEKRVRGQWHLENARRSGKSSILTDAYKTAISRGLTHDQALEYVRDVAYKNGWSKEGERHGINKYTDKSYRETLINYTNNIIKEDIQKREKNLERYENGLSALGTVFSSISHPVTAIAGALAQLPATYRDFKNYKNDPSLENKIDLVIDFVSPIPQVPLPVDDVTRSIGGISDAYTAITGRSLAGDIINKVKKRRLSKEKEEKQ